MTSVRFNVVLFAIINFLIFMSLIVVADIQQNTLSGTYTLTNNTQFDTFFNNTLDKEGGLLGRQRNISGTSFAEDLDESNMQDESSSQENEFESKWEQGTEFFYWITNLGSFFAKSQVPLASLQKYMVTPVSSRVGQFIMNIFLLIWQVMISLQWLKFLFPNKFASN